MHRKFQAVCRYCWNCVILFQLVLHIVLVSRRGD